MWIKIYRANSFQKEILAIVIYNLENKTVMFKVNKHELMITIIVATINLVNHYYLAHKK